MMANLFDIFDPMTSKALSLNWMSLILPFFIMPMKFWNCSSRNEKTMTVMFLFLKKEMKTSFKIKNMKSYIVFMGVFFMLLVNNMLGLLPYIFTPTSHLSASLGLCISFWLTLMIYGWIKHTNIMFSHLIPNGTPLALSVFMVFIETISNTIRPITLAVRLTANMIAGHLLITLLSGIPSNNYLFYCICGPVMMVLLLLEMAVAMIQSYVFITLTSLYMNEI